MAKTPRKPSVAPELRGDPAPGEAGPSACGPRWKGLPAIAGFLLVAAFTVAFAVRLSDFNVDLRDEGVAAMDAWRIAEGQKPYADFYEIIPPASFYPTALCIRLMGPTVWAVRLPALILALLLMFVSDRLLVALGVGLWARAAGLAFLGPWGVSFWPMPSHHWYAIFFQVAATAAVARGLDSPRRIAWGTAAGALTALTAFSMQDQGGYLILGLPLLVFPWGRNGRAEKWALFAGWAGGGLFVGAVFGALLLPHASLSDLWEQWFRFVVSDYRQAPAHRLGPLGIVDELLRIWREGLWKNMPAYSILVTANLAWVYCLPVFAGASLLHLHLVRWRTAAHRGLLLCGVLVALGAAAHRYCLGTLALVACALMTPILLACQEMASGGSRAWRRVGATILGLVLVLSLGFAFLQYRLSTPDKALAVRAPAGTLYSLVPAHGRLAQELIWAVEAHVPKGAPMATRGFIPYINYLTGHPNPTRYNFFIHPMYHNDAQAEEMVETLERLKVPFVVSTTIKVGPSLFDDYLDGKYRCVWYNSDYSLSKRVGE